MKIEVEIKRSDYADFNQYYYYKKGILKRLKVVLLAAVLIPIIVNIGKPFYFGVFLMNIFISGIVFGIIYLGLGYINIKRTGRIPSENGSILGKKSFIVSDDGLIEESENYRNLQKWSGFRSVESNKNSIFLFVDKIAAYIIPKRSFESEEQLINFLDLINTKINATQQTV